MIKKIYGMMIIILILSIGISQPLVSAFEFKQKVKLPKEEFEKRVIKYINTPDELKIYLPDMIHEEEDVSPADFCNVSKEVKDLIPDKKDGVSSAPNLIFKNTNIVIFDMVESISKVDVKDLSGTIVKLFDTYQVPRGTYPSALLNAQIAEKMRDWAQSNSDLKFEGNDPCEIDPTYPITSKNNPVTYEDFLYILGASDFTWDGHISYHGMFTKRSYIATINELCEDFNNNFCLIKSYGDLAFLNGILSSEGKPLFKIPSPEYRAAHPEYNALVLATDERVQFLNHIDPATGTPKHANFLSSAELRPLNKVGEPVKIKTGSIQAEFLIHGFATEDIDNMFKQRTYEQMVNKFEYASGAAMLVFAIIMLIVNFVYR
jgi:hypothetical protein